MTEVLLYDWTIKLTWCCHVAPSLHTVPDLVVLRVLISVSHIILSTCISVTYDTISCRSAMFESASVAKFIIFVAFED